MCERYVAPGAGAIDRLGNLGPANWQPLFRSSLMPSYNVAPLHIVPVIRMVDGRPQVTGMRWGSFPRVVGDSQASVAINARSEAIGSSPAFQESWKRGQRCLIPASGFYVWRAEPAGKQPWFVGCADQDTFAFAGLWESSTAKGGEVDVSCSIVTLPASPRLRDLDNARFREPAILRREDWDAWLGGEPDAAMTRLRQYPDDRRVAWPVAKRVNSCMQNDAQLLERVAFRAGKPLKKPARSLGRAQVAAGRALQVANRD